MKKLSVIIFLLSCFISIQSLVAHCEIPCGIYNDQMRIHLIEEHITTVEKSIKKIDELSKEKNSNQLVRWILNKDKHADKIQNIVTQYFMTQRIKFVAKENSKLHAKYIKEITTLHQLLIYAMKTKQSLDLSNIKKLRQLLAEFELSYFKVKK